MSRTTCSDAARVYIGCVALVGAVAAVLVAAGLRHEARELIPLGFARVRARPHAVLSIALANARVALVPFALSVLAHQGPAIRRIADVCLGGLLVLNACQLGAALAGYGLRTVVALVPHLPLELAGYAVAGAAYVGGRRAQPGLAGLAVLAALSSGLLLLAATIETYVQLRVAR